MLAIVNFAILLFLALFGLVVSRPCCAVLLPIFAIMMLEPPIGVAVANKVWRSFDSEPSGYR